MKEQHTESDIDQPFEKNMYFLEFRSVISLQVYHPGEPDWRIGIPRDFTEKEGGICSVAIRAIPGPQRLTGPADIVCQWPGIGRGDRV